MLIENYIFPLAFLYYAFRSFVYVITNVKYLPNTVSRLVVDGFYGLTVTYLSMFLYNICLIFFNCIVIRALLMRKNLQIKPRGFLEIFIPLCGTFYYLMFSVLPYLPEKMNILLFPNHQLIILQLFGWFFAITGTIIALKAIHDLRESFGIFVQVREVVTTGLYRYVRHPIYLGYFIILTGLVLMNLRIFYILVFLLATIFTILRAILEEKKLSEASQEYKDYIKTTPFIFPIRFTKSLER